MGKRWKLYQTRRVLAMILAVTMVVGMIPSTALAAPGDDGTQTVESTGATVQTTEETTDGSSADATDADGDNSAAGTDEAANGTGADSAAAGAEGTADGTDDNTAAVTGDGSTAADQAAQAAKPEYKILVSDMETQAVYTGSMPFDLSAVELQKTENGDSEYMSALENGVTASWEKQGADGSFTALAAGAEPVDAGVYKLTLTYAAVTDVHDGAVEKVICEIAKAPVTISQLGGYADNRITVAPGTLKENVKLPTGEFYVASAGDQVSSEHITLTIIGIRDAVTNDPVKDGMKLVRNGDYVADIELSWKNPLPAGKQQLPANYELSAFTADIVAADLIDTYVEVTLAQKWEDAGTVVLKAYDGNPAAAPKLTDDYTYEVMYYDQTAGEYKKLEGAEAVGKWAEYDGCEYDKDGKEQAPTDAGTYSYLLVYEDTEGAYGQSDGAISVEITPAILTVEATNKAPLSVLEGTTVQEVLSGVTYKVTKVTSKDGKDTTEDVTKKMKTDGVWGTGYDDSNVSQIYEPAFTLQESADDGKTYENIEDASYRLVSGRKYRVIYDGKKAVYNADGTYAHRTDVNDSNNINGIDYNYSTDTTPTAADKALEVTVAAGTEVTIDLSKLVGEKKGAKTIANLTAKEYDGAPIYGGRSEYKNNISLSVKEDDKETSKKPLLKELDCQWYRYNGADDLLGAQIDEKNQQNGFESYGPADDDRWTNCGNTLIAPKDAGVYKLVVTYTDQTDDSKLYYAKEPAVVYYAIDPVQVKIVPKGEYKTLEGRNGYDLLYKQHKSDTYELQKADGKGSAVVQGESVEPLWQVVETRQEEGSAEPVVNTYNYENWYDFNFEINDKVTYALQGYKVNELYWNDDDSFDGESIDNKNYTCYTSRMIETGEANADGNKYVERHEDLLGDMALITVTPMGTKKLTVSLADAAKPIAKEKVYDAKPFTEKELVEGAVVVTDETGAAITGQALADIGIEYVAYEEGNDNFSDLSWSWLNNVGEYGLYACFYGNETYAPLVITENPSGVWNPDEEGVKLGTFKITPRTISLKAALPETYTAGVYAEQVLDAIPGSLTVEGYAEDDAWAFTEYREWDEDSESEIYYMDAWSDEWDKKEPSFCIYEKGSKNPVSLYDQLAKDKTYEVRYDYDASSMTMFYGIGGADYLVSGDAVAEFTVVKGNSAIASVEYDNISSFAIKVKNDEKDSMKRTVTMQEGIGFTSVTLEDGTELEGNLAAFRITAPAEYEGSMPSTAMYQNEIRKANGYIVDRDAYDDNGNVGFTVIFDAAEGTKNFPIRWEDGYVENYTINFNDAVKLGNLYEAVAPKSIAFNAPDKKMAVGQSQQLDVKITKAQMGDVICLGYKSSDEKVLTVNENGYVTALKVGKANITVFPQRYVKGKLEPIPGAKEVSVTITTTKLTAPKTVKVTAHGAGSVTAKLSYDTPKDGYRREIYVVDNNNRKTASVKKAADFEKLLAGTGEDSWKENKWQGTFAVAPIYLDGADEALNRRRNNYAAQISGLATKGAYTVYVRNVCAAKTLADGSVITNDAVNESAAGTTVSFKTLKSELIDLELQMNDTLDGVTDVSDWKDVDGADSVYEINLAKLAKGTVDSTTYGRFYTMPKDDAAQRYDSEWIMLPLKEKADKDAYENPKLEYTLANCWNKKTQRYEYGTKNDIASIDKKGKIKITGMTGEDHYLTVRVRDLQTNVSCYVALYILAQPDSVMAVKKSVNLSVGERQDLNSLLSYKMGKQKLTYYPYADVDMNAVKAAIKEQKQEQFFKLNNNSELQAIAGGGSLTLELTDRNVARDFDKDKATAKVTFKSTELTGVKKIKAYDVINDSFGLTFTYAGGADAFMVEIADANKTVLSKKFVTGGYDSDKWDETGGYCWVDEVYDSKGNRVKDTYKIDPWQIKAYVRGGLGLTKETQYTVKITALYDETAAKKPATAKVKTTKIPAAGGYIDDNYYDDAYNTIRHRGGMSIYVGEYSDGYHLSEDENHTSLRVLSGNSYTLTAEVPNLGRVNDTLVWTVDNAKVATVKAAAGSYCITLKGVKPGHTLLEVKSKIWGNKVVARYDIYVVAVGDAYKDTNRYYGDNESGDYIWAPVLNNGSNNAPQYLPLSVGDPRKVTANQRETFSFTAPEAGRYRMEATGYVGGSIYLQKTTRPSKGGYYSLDLGWLKAGDTVQLSSQVYNMDYDEPGNISYFVEVTLAQRVEEMSAGTQTVKGTGSQGLFKFTAPEEGRYQFSVKNSWSSTEYLYLFLNEDSALQEYSSNYESYGSTVECQLAEGDSVWVKTSGSLYSGDEYTFSAEKISESIDLTAPAQVTVAAQGKKYLTFTASKDGFYKFSSAADTTNSSVYVDVEINGNSSPSDSMNNFSKIVELHEGDSVCLIVTNNDYYNDYSFTLTTAEVTFADVQAGAETVITDGAYYQFMAPEAGMYELSSVNGGTVTLYESAADAINAENSLDQINNSAVEREFAAGEVIYLSADVSGAADCKLLIKKISMELELTDAGTEITVDAGKNVYVTFTASEDAYYRLAAADDTTEDTNISVKLELADGSIASSSTSKFDFKKDLKAGDVVRLKITNNGTSSYTFTVKAAKVTIPEVPTAAVTLASGDVTTGYQYTAADTGLYQFRMESEEEITALGLYDSMEALVGDESSEALAIADAKAVTEDSGNSGDGNESGSGTEGGSGDTEGGDGTGSSDPTTTTKYVCEITYLLRAGQTVYVNPRNSSNTDNLAVTLSVEKKTADTLGTNDRTINAPVNQKVEVTYTALEDGIYTFHASGATDTVYVDLYTSYGGDNDCSLWDLDNAFTLSSSTTSDDRQIVLMAGQTVVWTLRAVSSDQDITLSVTEDRALKELHVGDTLQAECNNMADLFVFTAPSDGWYTFWSESGEDTYGVLYSAEQVNPARILEDKDSNEGDCLADDDQSGPDSDFAISYELKFGQKVYLKARYYYSNKTGTFNVCAEAGQRIF